MISSHTPQRRSVQGGRYSKIEFKIQNWPSPPADLSSAREAKMQAGCRRRFMAFLGGFGIAGVAAKGLWAAAEENGVVTVAALAHAETLAGLEFTDDERELMLEGVNDLKADYAALREGSLPTRCRRRSLRSPTDGFSSQPRSTAFSAQSADRGRGHRRPREPRLSPCHSARTAGAPGQVFVGGADRDVPRASPAF